MVVVAILGLLLTPEQQSTPGKRLRIDPHLLADLPTPEQAKATVDALAVLPKAPAIEVILLPSAARKAIELHRVVKRRTFKRGDRAILPLLKTLAKNQREFPGSIPMMCGFHADALIRPSVGKQVALCFHCRDAVVTPAGKEDRFSFQETPAIGGWSMMPSKPIASELVRLFPGETFPR